MPSGIYIRTIEAKRNMSVAKKGKKQPKEQILKRAISLRGRKRKPFSKEWREKISIASRNRKHSEETRKKISLQRQGNKSNFWKGGIDRKVYKHYTNLQYKLWREFVFKRDDYTCQKCNKKGIFLHPHHIKSYTHYPELRYEVLNGITLCKDCHNNLHWYKKLEV